MAKKKKSDAKGKKGEAPVSSKAAVQRSFAKATKELAKMLRGREAIYRIPWFGMIGEPGSEKDDLLPGSGLSARPNSPDTFGLEGSNANQWWFYNNAVIIDFADSHFSALSEKLDDEEGGFFGRFRRKKGAQNAWKVNLDALRKQRLRRPLDGMILAINAKDLLKRTPDALSNLSRRAEVVADRIHEAQHRLGVHFPVYVVLTGCESMPGFGSFTDTLPEPMRDQMFGWSSPYDPEQAYQTEWVDEAVGSIHESVCVTQLDLLPTLADQDQRDLLYMLPRDMQTLRESLKHYLDPIFKATSYRRALPLRGIYLTANLAPKPEPAEPEPGAPPRVPGMDQVSPPEPVEKPPAKPVFVKQLFSEKIFQEPGLATLDEEHNLAVRKTVKRARLALIVTLVIGGLLAWYQHAVTTSRVDDFHSLLALMQSYQSPSARRKAATEASGSVDTLKTLSRLEVEQFEIFTAPSSYFVDTLTDDAKQAIAKVLGRSVADPLRDALKGKTNLLLPEKYDALQVNGSCLNISEDALGTRDVKALLEDLSAMHTFTSQVVEYHAYFDLYNRHEPEDLVKVYTFINPEDHDLEDTTDSESRLFREALLNTSLWPRAEFSNYALLARKKILADARQFQCEQFVKHPLRKALNELAELMDTIESKQDEYFVHLQRVRAAIAAVETQIAGERAIWLLPEEFDKVAGRFGKYEELITTLDGSIFPKGEDGQVADADADGLGKLFAATNQIEFRRLRTFIDEKSSRLLLNEPILQRKDLRVVLSPKVQQIKQAIDDLMLQPYVTRPGQAATIQATLQRDAGARALWNSMLLKRTISWHQQYTNFIKAKRSEIPPEFAIALQTSAHLQFRDRTNQVLEVAKPIRLDQSNEDQNTSWTAQARDTLKEQIRNIAQEQPNIERIMSALKDVHQALNEPEDNSLFNALRDDSNALLEQVDSVLESEKLYAIRGDRFSWWDSDQPPCVVAFGARDPNDLLSRLGVQQKAIATLSKDFARPLVDYMLRMGEPFVSDPDVDRWRKIGEVLEEYEKKVPGNGLEELERFVEEDLCKLRLSACSEQLEKHKDRFNRDNYFKDRKYRIALDMERRCDDILRQVTVQGYVDLQQFFVDKMQGRFPFAGPDVPAEVETGDIVEFFNRFERYSGAFKALITDDGVGSSSLFGKATPEVKRFISQVEKVRPMFASLLSAEDDNPDLVLDIDFNFRVNRENEINGNQIIQWWAQLGEQRIDHRDNKSATQWRTNDSVAICLRWARDAMFIPAPNQRSEQARVNGRQACYVFGGRFALLRLLSMHAATPADRGRRSFLRPHTLRFETETSLASAQRNASSLLVTDTRVYVRIGVVLPGAKSAFRMPEFPRRAPELTTEFLRANGIVAKGKGG